MSWEVDVFSSNVLRIGWQEPNDLIVTWKNGKRSAYSGVPESLATECSKAASVGQFLNSEIKPHYSHRYI